jgi:bifunctional non-homologous end joining protein LigD
MPRSTTKGWIFEDKYDGFRMVAKIEDGSVTLYSRNGKIVSHSYIEVAKALEGVKGDAVIDGELVAIGEDGISHFQLLQNALRHQAKLQYVTFDFMFHDGDDLRSLALLVRKDRLKSILPRHKLIAFSSDRKTFGTKFFDDAQRKGLEGIMAKRADSEILVWRPDGQLAEDQYVETPGSCYCRLHGTEAYTSVLRSARAGPARRQ